MGDLNGTAIYLALSGAVDGITVNRRGDTFAPTNGFMVGNGPLGFVIDETDADGGWIIERFNEWFDNADVYNSELFGAWVDGGQRYLDVVDFIENRNDAISLAKTRGELAIWDNENQEEIVTS